MNEDDPPTTSSIYGSGDVSAIFQGAISPSTLQYLDETGYLRPSFYAAPNQDNQLISPVERDQLIAARGRTRGDPRRQYTYVDLVWIRLFLYVKSGLTTHRVSSAGRKAGEIIRALRERTGTCPSASRMIVAGKDVYLLQENTIAECLTQPGQLGLMQIVTDQVAAEVRGRVEALAAHQKVRVTPIEDQHDRTTVAGVTG